jgi:TATA-box binding protein (TBP) (component of TFIID and TFIIIB)
VVTEGVPVIWAELAVSVAVKVIVWAPALSEMLKLLNVATPVVEVATAVVPERFPGPEALVAVMV